MHSGVCVCVPAGICLCVISVSMSSCCPSACSHGSSMCLGICVSEGEREGPQAE